jgi:hypothetical protein
MLNLFLRKDADDELGLFMRATGLDDKQISLTAYFYPYRSQAKNLYSISPYEDYKVDLEEDRRSSYGIVQGSQGRWFGISVALLIILVFAIIKPSELVSIESLVSVLGAYVLGQGIWQVQVSYGRTISWHDPEYIYQKINFGTIQQFWDYARGKHEKSTPIRADKFDFISHSNHKTVDLLYTDLKGFSSEKPTKLLSMHFREAVPSGILGVKLAVIKSYGPIKLVNSYYQAMELPKRQLGTVTKEGEFLEDKLLMKSSIQFGRLIVYFNLGTLLEKKIFG